MKQVAGMDILTHLAQERLILGNQGIITEVEKRIEIRLKDTFPRN